MVDLLSLQKHFILAHLREGDTAVDFTMGNGYDTVFLSKTVGSSGSVTAFDIQPDANKKPGDRYQLGYKLMRGGNEFKVCLSVDYTDGSTAQIARGTNSNGWITIDVQSDTARQVRRIYGYLSYDIKRGHTAYVDSLMLMHTLKSLAPRSSR